MIRFFISLLAFATLLGAPQVTYEPSGGRVGDHLITYLHAKWISYKYGIPLAFHPFLFSEAFAVHKLETPLDSSQEVVPVTDLSMLNNLEDKVYQILYVTECMGEYLNGHPYWHNRPFIHVDWNDQDFIEWVRPCLEPRIPVKLLPLPSDKVTVALHIRRPYGIDGYESVYQIFPYKFLPDQFYVDQLRWIYEEMGRRPLYVYLFSNDPRTRKIAAILKLKVNNRNITFDYPNVLNETREGVLDDFFSMMHFDCMVRPDSNLSIVASKLGYQTIVISPEHVTVNKKGNVVDRVRIERR